MTLTKIASERRFSFEYQPNAQTAAVMQAVRDGQAPMQRAAGIDALLEQINAAD